VVPGHALGSVSLTYEVEAARCAYDFVMPHAQCDAATARWIRGGDHEIVRVIFCFGLVGLLYFLDGSLGERARVAASA